MGNARFVGEHGQRPLLHFDHHASCRGGATGQAPAVANLLLAERLPHRRGDRHVAFQHPHFAAAAGALAATGEFDARLKEPVGQRLPRKGMEFELHGRLRAKRVMASTLACGVPRGTSQPAPQM